MLGNTRFISRVEHDISHSFAALTGEICSTLEINVVFPSTHVLFFIYINMPLLFTALQTLARLDKQTYILYNLVNNRVVYCT